MKTNKIFNRILYMLGLRERFKVADEMVTLMETTAYLNEIKSTIENAIDYYPTDVQFELGDIATGDITVRVEPEDSYNFVLKRSISLKSLRNETLRKEFVNNIIELVLENHLYSEVFSVQKEMFVYLEQQWPEVTADLILAGKFKPPIDDRQND